MTSLWRSTVWFFTGYRHFTKSAYEKLAALPDWDDVGAMRADGRTMLVTGGNSGIGYAAAEAFAKAGADVHILCRNRERGEAAVGTLRVDSGNEHVTLHVCDVSRPADIVQFCADWNAAGRPLHVLVNNAGALFTKRDNTPDGLDMDFATNLLSHFMVTALLLPSLQRAGSARVINVSSGGMYLSRLNPEELEHGAMNRDGASWDGNMAYAHSKRAMVELTKKFQQLADQKRTHDQQQQQQRGSDSAPPADGEPSLLSSPTPTPAGDVAFFSMHPGWTFTPGVEAALPSFHEKTKSWWRTPPQGADTIVWLALKSDLEKQLDKRAAFFLDRAVVTQHLSGAGTLTGLAQRDELWTKLWGYFQAFAPGEARTFAATQGLHPADAPAPAPPAGSAASAADPASVPAAPAPEAEKVAPPLFVHPSDAAILTAEPVDAR